MTGLLELAEQVEAATGPDRELDCLIAVAALGFFEVAPRWEGGPIGYGYINKDGERIEPGHGGDQLVRKFTASLDAAMTLVPEGVGAEILTIDLRRANLGSGIIWHRAVLTDTLNGDFWRADKAASFALALVEAALRSRAALVDKVSEI